jgi:GntR family transcriptional regulator
MNADLTNLRSAFIVLARQLDPTPRLSTTIKTMMRTIDKSNPIPYYVQLADLLRLEIGERKGYDGLSPLPSENQLLKRFNVSRSTVRNALSLLEREGLIYRQKGKGSFIAVRRVEHELTQLVSTTEDMRRRGWDLTTRVIGIKRLTPVSKIAEALELSLGGSVYQLIRLRIVKGKPLSLQTAYLPEQLYPGLDEHDLSASLFYLSENVYQHRYWTGRQVLRARAATREEAALLKIHSGAPVMYAERVTYSVKGTPIEYLEAIWRGDRYDFAVSLSRP